jgi:hypothetical protein
MTAPWLLVALIECIGTPYNGLKESAEMGNCAEHEN